MVLILHRLSIKENLLNEDSLTYSASPQHESSPHFL